MRQLLFQTGWALARPLRAYLRHGPPNRRRWLIEAALVQTLLRLAPPSFVAELPFAGSLELRYRERIGLSTLLGGPFEQAETEELCRHARPGTTAVDAGANIGLFTIPFAHAVGRTGRVFAFEPTDTTAERLRENVQRNALTNIMVVEAALGRTRGTAMLALAPDAAYNSITSMRGAPTTAVEIVPLDAVWEQEGRPEISVLKVDVEGSELDVLEGARGVLASCRPAIMVELAEPAKNHAVEALLAAHGYVRSARAGFQPWNHLFLPAHRRPD